MTPNPTGSETDDGVLTPDDLQLDDDRVDELGANRYVVRSDGAATSESDFTAAIGAAGDAPAMDAESAAIGASARDAVAETAPVDALEDAPEPYGIDVTLKTDGELARLQTTSRDVREVFTEMLTWYANQLDDDLTPAQALEVMLATTNLDEPV